MHDDDYEESRWWGGELGMWFVHLEPGASRLFVCDWEVEARDWLARFLPSFGVQDRSAGDACSRCGGDAPGTPDNLSILLLNQLMDDEGTPTKTLHRECVGRFCSGCSRRLAPIFEGLKAPNHPDARPSRPTVRNIQVAYDESDLFVVVDGVKVGQRGRKGTPDAGRWISLAPGWAVIGEGPTGTDGLVVEYQGRRIT